ncbi:MAG: alpha/beta fold hydrolase [Stackebrandtia sp.]
MADSYITRAGARIAYQYKGSGKPFGYSHGIFLSRQAVRRLELFDFDSLGAGRNLLIYDQRGHGHSTGRPVADDYRFDNVARDLLAVMDDAEIDEPMDFAGSSLGAATALGAAVVQPQRFRRLVLLIPPDAWGPESEQSKQWYLDHAATVERDGAAAWRRAWASAEPLPIFAEYPKFELPPDISDQLLAAVLRGVGESTLPAPEQLAALTHPMLILTWETDPLHPVATAERLRDLIPNAELHVATTATEVQTWTRRVADFIAG